MYCPPKPFEIYRYSKTVAKVLLITNQMLAVGILRVLVTGNGAKLAGLPTGIRPTYNQGRKCSFMEEEDQHRR